MDAVEVEVQQESQLHIARRGSLGHTTAWIREPHFLDRHQDNIGSLGWGSSGVSESPSALDHDKATGMAQATLVQRRRW
jgi:hypothetical protein